MTTPHTKEYHGTSPETGAGHHRRALVFSFSVDGYMRSLGEKSQLTSLKWWFRTSDILWNPVLHPDVVMFTTALLSHHCKSSLDSSTDDFYARTSSHPEWSKYPTWVMTDQVVATDVILLEDMCYYLHLRKSWHGIHLVVASFTSAKHPA